MESRAVTHPSADTLQAFGLGKLDDASAGAVMNHLEECHGMPPGRGVAVRRQLSGAAPPGAWPLCHAPSWPVCRPSRAAAGRRTRPSQPHLRIPTCRRSWPTIPSTRSSASWAGAAWESFTWRITG